MATRRRWRTGKARSLLRVRRPLTAVDGTGGSTGESQVVGEAFAVINTMYGVSGIYGEKIGSEITHEITIRDFPGIQQGWSLDNLETGASYNVIHVDEGLQNNSETILWCRERGS